MWKSWGVYECGCVDVEWSAEQPVAGRIYYPAPKSSGDGSSGSWLTPWRWRLPFSRGQPWLPHINYARGLARFLFFRLHGRFYDALKQAFIGLVWGLGKSARLGLHPGAPLAPEAPGQLPLVVFSHGLGGHRFLYTIICAELASQGYAVLALDHADGSASAARLPGGEWKLYGGLGNEEAQVAKTRVRVAEMKAGLAMMQALHRGDRLPGLKLSDGRDASSFFKGRLDMRCVAAAGHSYGGATTTALVAEDPRFACAIALDPWWFAVFPESQALRRFQTRTPLLIMGSHDWNTPNQFGQLSCGGERQELVLKAAAAKLAENGGGAAGGGAMLLSIAGSSHNTFADVLPLFSRDVSWLLERLGLSARLDPVLGIHLCTSAMLAFLSLHLPLTPEQRSVQNWEPSKPASAPRWAAIQQRDAADSGESSGGPFSWLFPGRGLILTLSDTLLNHILPRPTAFRQVPPAAAQARLDNEKAGLRAGPKAAAGAAGGEIEPEGEQNGGPDDVLSGAEVAETALPSAHPASGLHPHAPGARTDAPQLTGATRPSSRLSGPAFELANGADGSEEAASEARQAALRAGFNQRFSPAVEAVEAEEMAALLGRHHIFKCLTV